MKLIFVELLKSPMFITIALVTVVSCKKNPVGPQVTPYVELSADYVTCTEVWLKLGFTDSPGGGDYRITRDGETVLHGSFSGTNTVVYDTTALANKTYSYVAYRLVNGQVSQISATVAVTTLDSTSNNFTWQTFTLGDGNSSKLNDVAIVSDTLIYAVGEIYLRDSTGQFEVTPYNVSCWKGTTWELTTLKFFPPGSIGDSATGPGSAIFARSASDIWIVAGPVYHFDGTKWSCFYNTGADGANRIWGDNEGNLWLVGKNGIVVRYDGTQWQTIASGTNYLISNIWGSSTKILCVTTESKLLNISDNLVSDTLSWSGIPIRGIWFGMNTPVYVSGQGVWSDDGNGWKQMSDLTNIFYTGIRGTDTNDMFVVGPYGTLAHYNGSTWHTFDELANPVWNFQSVEVKNDIVVAVGSETVSIGGLGVVAIGTRIMK
jgi:hypothetical protein